MNLTHTWPDGDRTPWTVQLDIVADTTPEADEDFRVFLSNPTGGALLGVPFDVILTLTNDLATGRHGRKCGERRRRCQKLCRHGYASWQGEPR